MAKSTFLSFSTTAGDNTDIDGIGTQGTNAVSNFDNAFRTLMAILRRDLDNGAVFVTKSAGYTAVAGDNNAFYEFTATATLALTAAATLAADWHMMVFANGGVVTVDPDASEQINGATTLTIASGDAAYIICTGTAFKAITIPAAANVQRNSGEFYREYIAGLVLTNNASDATNDIDIAAGSAGSDGATPVLMTLASALTKRLDAAWAVGSGNGGLDTGSIGNNVYYAWLIQRSDTGVVDALFSLSSTAPTMPTNYDRKRIIGSFARVGGVNNAPRSYSQKEPTPWVAYTPTFVAVGTVSNLLCRSRRVGSNLEIEASWVNGTVSGSAFSMTLGFKGANGVVVCDSYWNSRVASIGSVVVNYTGVVYSAAISSGGVGTINIGSQTAASSGYTPTIGTSLGTGSGIALRCSIPIEGWN